MFDESKDEIYEEDVIINPLLRFKEFESFYIAERNPQKNNNPIIWKVNPTQDVFAAFDSDEEKKPFIRVHRLPKTFNDAFLVSHELMHSVMCFKG